MQFPIQYRFKLSDSFIEKYKTLSLLLKDFFIMIINDQLI